MTGKKYIDFFRSMPSGRGELSAGKCPRCEQSTARPRRGVRLHGPVRGAVPRDPPDPERPPPRAPDGRHRDIRAAPPRSSPAPPGPQRLPLPPARPPSRSPVAVRTNPRRSPSSAPSSSAPGGSATIPERSRCRDGGGTGTGGGGGAQVGTAPQVGAGIVGRGVLAPPPGVQTASPPIQSDLVTDNLLAIRAINS